MKQVLLLISIIINIPFAGYGQVTSELEQQIDLLFSEWDKTNSPGAAIGIIQHGKLIYTNEYGMANMDYAIPLTSDSKFYIASIAKQFTAACVALLVMDSKVKLDDDIRIYFPELPDYGHVITIRNLIHHTSGLRDYLSIMYLSGKSFEDYFNNSDGLEIIARQKALNFIPNQEYLYSNSNYILLAELVKRTSGMTIRKYADQYIFKPLGMNNTFFNDDHTQITENRVVSYKKMKEGVYKRFVQNFDGHGDGGMISTINDLLLWDQNFYDKKVGGQLLQDIILSRQKLENGFLSVYSFGIEHGQYKGLKINMHGGNFLGFNHHFTRFPDQSFSVIVLANTNEVDPYFITDRVSDLFLSEYYKTSNMAIVNDIQSHNDYNVNNEELESFEGSYWNEDGNFSRNIYVLDDTLRFDRGMNNISELIPISRNEFKMLVNGNVKVTFKTQKDAPNKMIVTINETDFFSFRKYEPAKYSQQDLESYSGSYYSPELECTYVLKLLDNQLVLYINDEVISTLNPVMKNFFTNDFAGTFLFNENNQKEFMINSGRVRGILFSKQ